MRTCNQQLSPTAASRGAKLSVSRKGGLHCMHACKEGQKAEPHGLRSSNVPCAEQKPADLSYAGAKLCFSFSAAGPTCLSLLEYCKQQVSFSPSPSRPDRTTIAMHFRAGAEARIRRPVWTCLSLEFYMTSRRNKPAFPILSKLGQS